MMYVALSYDHRIVDGGGGVTPLQDAVVEAFPDVPRQRVAGGASTSRVLG